MKKVLLSGKGVCKRFPGNGDPVLDRIDVEIFEGDFTIIMGASGAGKSTLLYTLSGMDRLSSGQVFYREQEISGFREQQMADLRAREFGFVFQQTHLVSNLTLFENVAVAGYLKPGRDEKSVRERAGQLLRQMHAEKAKDRLPYQVSGGEGQRAAIARAVINQPGLIFADEPTGALNKKNSEEVLDLLTTINEAGQSILMVTHDLRAAARGTRLLYLEDGKIIGECSMPRYTGNDLPGREAQISAWLGSVGW